MKTFKDVIDVCVAKAKIASTQTSYVDMLKAGVNKRYTELMVEKKWWFRRFRRDLSIAAARTTGTCGVTATQRTVTFTTALTANLKGCNFQVEGDQEVYTILGIDGAGQAVLSAPYIGATAGTASYHIWRSEFGLWPDCEEINDIWTDSAGGTKRPLEPIGPRAMAELIAADPRAAGVPRVYTRYGKNNYLNDMLGHIFLGHDFLSSTEKKYENLIVYPSYYTSGFILHADYSLIVNPMVNDGDIPLIPAQYLYLLVDGGLAEFFSDMRNYDKAGVHETQYQNKKQQLLRKNDDIFDTPKMVIVGMRPRNVLEDYPIAYGDSWDGIWEE